MRSLPIPAIPLGILQSKACSGQNKGITVTKGHPPTKENHTAATTAEFLLPSSKVGRRDKNPLSSCNTFSSRGRFVWFVQVEESLHAGPKTAHVIGVALLQPLQADRSAYHLGSVLQMRHFASTGRFWGTIEILWSLIFPPCVMLGFFTFSFSPPNGLGQFILTRKL